MDEDRVIGSMIKILRERPGEWLTVAYLSSLIAMPDCDGDLVGAMADFRPDLFAVSRDRKLKLRPEVAENISRQGISNWRVPERPEADPYRGINRRGAAETGTALGGCYCSAPDNDILEDLKTGSVPDEALVNSCCWKNICRVRGRFFGQVPDDTWTEICRRRGYIQQ
jgi:hypothetical protein